MAVVYKFPDRKEFSSLKLENNTQKQRGYVFQMNPNDLYRDPEDSRRPFLLQLLDQ